jgi:hypothetical protein
VITEIFDGILALMPFPGQGYRRPNLTSRPLRFKLVREYVIAYAPEKKPLWVVAVFHGRRSPRVIAAILRPGIGLCPMPSVMVEVFEGGGRGGGTGILHRSRITGY